MDAIADALFSKMKPFITQLVGGLLEPVLAMARSMPRNNGRAVSADLSGGSSAAEGAAARPATPRLGLASGATAESTRVMVREELDAFEERRLPALELRHDKTVKVVTDAVQKTVTACLKEKPVELMTDDEISQAVNKALPTRTIRQHHGPVLNETIKMLMEDERYEGDAFTSSFPPTSSLLDTLVNEAFNKIVLGILERVYNTNGEKPEHKQPHVFKGKEHVSPAAMDRVDRMALTLVRNVLHDPRCKTRRLAVVLYLYYFLPNAGSVKLQYPDAAKPSATDGAGSPYFAVQMELLASCSGLLPVGDAPAPKHKHDAPAGSPVAGVHKVQRGASLYAVALTLLLKLVREAFTFDAEVVFSVADTLRSIALDPDTAWTTMDHKEADETQKTKMWALLLPRVEVQVDASQVVQTLTTREKEVIQTRYQESVRAAQPPNNTAGVARSSGQGGETPSGSTNGAAAAPTPVAASSTSTDWLRRLAR